MTDPEAVHQMIEESWRLPPGVARIAVVEEAIRQADALHHPRLAFDARMAATEAYMRGGEHARMFVTFSWCLSAYDRDPGQFEAGHTHLLLWHFKFVVAALTRFPEVPLDRTYAVLDDMQRRYQAGGHSLHAVYQYRWLVAEHIGDRSATDAWYEKWFTAPRDDNSDCVGCDPTSKVAHLAARGRDEEAVALAQPVLKGGLSCVEQPQGILTELLLPYLRTGRHDEARQAHRRAYRAHRRHRANLVDVASHLYFCGVTGNEAHGLELVEAHLSWLEPPPSPYAAMRFAAASALVLGRLADNGHGDEPVGQAAVTVAALRARLVEQATGLAARFDARNGTPHQGQRIAAILAAAPLVDYLPLSTTAARPRTRTSAPTPAAPQLPPNAGAGQLLDLVEAHVRREQLAAASAVWAVLEETHPAARTDRQLGGRWAEVRGRMLATEGDLAAAEAQWRHAAESFAKLGDEVRRQVALGRIGLIWCLTGRVEEGAAQVETSTAYLAEHAAAAEQRAGALHRLANVRLVQERPDAAATALEEAAAHAAKSGDALLAAEIAVRRARCLAMLGRQERRRAVRDALRACREAGSPRLAEAAVLYGTELADAGELPSATEAFTEAIASATDFPVRLDALVSRSQALLAQDRAGEAVNDLVEAVATCTEQGAELEAALAQFELAQAYHEAGRFLEAAEAGEEAVAALAALGAQEPADRCRYLLVQIYRELSESEAALALLETLVENLNGFDHLPARAHMHEQAGDILSQQDRDREAADRLAAAADTYRVADMDLDSVRARRKQAVALHWAGRADEALAVLLEADTLASTLPGSTAAVTWERAMLGYEGARIAGGAGLGEEALSRIEGVAAAFRSVDAYGEAVFAELVHGELLLHTRPEAAEPLLRSALAGLPRDSDVVPHAARLLATALEAQGREEEVETLRQEYGLDP